MRNWPDPSTWAHVPTSLPRHPYLDGNDWAAFDRFAGRVRAMSDQDLADQFGIVDPYTRVLLRELAAS
jgi:hypothetical protein